MARRPDQHAKVALLRAAEQVFVARGLERATVEEITSRAGRSKGSFYLHFESKEQAFREIVESLLARMEAFLEAATQQGDPREPGEAVEALGRWLEHDLETFEFIWLNRGVFRLLLDGGKSLRFEYLVDGFAERARQASEARLRAGVAAGIYRADLDPEVTALFLTGAYDRLARALVHGERKPDLRAQLERMQQLVLRGVASAPLLDRIDRRVRKTAMRWNGVQVADIEGLPGPPQKEVRGDRRRRAGRGGRHG